MAGAIAFCLKTPRTPQMDMFRAGRQATVRANSAWFTGTVWQDPIVTAPEPARVRAARVAFEPGARTNWHTHPLGQTLHVVAGVGRFQTLGGPVVELRPGDTVWIPPHEKHWHGAAPTTGMVHIAIHEALDGTHVTWMEPVSDADYAKAPSA
jgi:quercetin dioxygenase-like cupin family protein